MDNTQAYGLSGDDGFQLDSNLDSQKLESSINKNDISLQFRTGNNVSDDVTQLFAESSTYSEPFLNNSPVNQFQQQDANENHSSNHSSPHTPIIDHPAEVEDSIKDKPIKMITSSDLDLIQAVTTAGLSPSPLINTHINEEILYNEDKFISLIENVSHDIDEVLKYTQDLDIDKENSSSKTINNDENKEVTDTNNTDNNQNVDIDDLFVTLKWNSVDNFEDVSLIDSLASQIPQSNIIITPIIKDPITGQPIREFLYRQLERIQNIDVNINNFNELILEVVKIGCWQAVPLIIKKVILTVNEKDIEVLGKLWNIRLISLILLKQNNTFSKELNKLLNFFDNDSNTDDNFIYFIKKFDYKTYGRYVNTTNHSFNHDTLIPYELLILWSLLPDIENNNYLLSIERIHKLINIYDGVLRKYIYEENSSKEDEKIFKYKSMIYKLLLLEVNLLLNNNGNIPALTIMIKLHEEYPDDHFLTSNISMLYLQLGDVLLAQKWIKLLELKLAKYSKNKNITIPNKKNDGSLEYFDELLGYIIDFIFNEPNKNENKEFILLSALVMQNRANWEIVQQNYDAAEVILNRLMNLIEFHYFLQKSFKLNDIINNISICRLYSGNLKQSIQVLNNGILSHLENTGPNNIIPNISIHNLLTLLDVAEYGIERRNKLFSSLAQSGLPDISSTTPI